jgi:hypothetical protein
LIENAILIELGWPEAVYVGESDNLSRRMAGYRNPGPSRRAAKVKR